MQANFLITGATGFVGHRLAEVLVDKGARVRLLVRQPENLPNRVKSSCEVVVGSLGDITALATAVSDVDVVFHCAANVSTWDRTEAYYEANVAGVGNLLNAICTHNPGLRRFIHLSTVDVYGFPRHPCDETDKTPDVGFDYGDTKRMGESIVRQFCDRVPYTIIRPANIIGPCSQLIERIGHAVSSGVMITIDGGRANAGLVFVDNLITYMIWAAQSEAATNEIFNVRDNYDVTWMEFVSTFRKAIAGKGIVINLPFVVAETIARALETFHVAILPGKEPTLHRLLVRILGRTCGHSARKIRNVSGIDTEIGFDEAIRQSAHWFLSEVNTD